MGDLPGAFGPMIMLKSFLLVYQLLLTIPIQWYASYISSYVWAGLFLGPKIKKLWQNRKNLAAYRTDRLK